MRETPTYNGLRGLWIAIALCAFSLKAAPQAGEGGDPPNAPFVVVLDAGHGGHDPGNLGNGYLEKNIALKIVLEVGKRLEAVPGIKVVYTRKDDSFVDLYVRGQIANKAKADLFVSVHCDSHTSNANGAGTFVLGLHANKQNFEIAKKENSVIYLEDNYETRYAEYDINSPESVIGLTIMQEEFLDQSIMLGKMMQDRFTKDLKRNDRKVKQAGFIVLHQTFMPSVLVETGFLTNKNEGSYLNSTKGQKEMGQAISKAIVEYRESIGANTGPLLADASELPAETLEKQDSDAVESQEPVVTKQQDSPVQEQKDPPIQKQKDPPVLEDSAQNMEAAAAVVAAGTAGAAGKEAAQTDRKATTKTTQSKPPIEQKQQPSQAVEEAIQSASPQVVFKIQLMAVSKDPDLIPSRFNGLKPLSKEKFQSLYRILYGNTASYNKALGLQKEAVKAGYGSAYIVAYRDGVRIPVKDAVPQGSR